ncbi:type I polyketide synthase [Nocardia sp. CDC159]|uniref:Type I polyketide synthase n=1 Tax=Nocardia pulmonis TaxID=2951408 RepID=A0A9X2ECE9_9NOCA|nr:MULTISPECIES: type I polyketide synthase [Nocardia]MCM6776658.1 type I polyketide synthase [Nocardia pulmonis]MCM6789193.1 type I polyketide synthase [Nocardia sp. CDC159]
MDNEMDIAVIGMSGRFPGAPDLAAFWDNLCAGSDSGERLDHAVLRAAGVPADLLSDPNYVPVAQRITGLAEFDADFFGFTAREAAMLDPQQRLFLECAWHTFETAKLIPGAQRDVGVFAGANMPAYLISNLLHGEPLRMSAATFLLQIHNDKDYVASRTAYKLGLTGPAFTVQTACSSGLAAVHQAVAALLGGECRLALAGGVCVRVPHDVGYLYEDGLIFSPDGRTRSFDAEANGTMFGSGVGTVLLQRLDDALAEGNRPLAVIKATAMNNDGDNKIGFTAPSIDGQAEVIATALELSGIDAADITAIEAHGTATPIGDPMEVAALTKVFREYTDQRSFCGISSVKSNVGHLESAAGIAGFIKAVLQIQHRMLAPTANFTAPNPAIRFPTTPFSVVDRLTAVTGPVRIGVSSFGVGGTNVHAILESPPESPAPRSQPRGHTPALAWVVSGRGSAALAAQAERLAEFSTTHAELDPVDVGYALATTRATFDHRAMVFGTDRHELLSGLRALAAGESAPGLVSGAATHPTATVLLFPGQGAQRNDLGRDLYHRFPVFAATVDEICAQFDSRFDPPLRDVLFAAPGTETAALLDRTAYTQAGLFAVEVALFRLVESWGVRPDFLLGHSIGEISAAYAAGLWSLPDACTLVAARGQLMQALPDGGAMISLAAGESEVAAALDGYGDRASVAAINGPAATVVSGTADVVAELAATFTGRGRKVKRLNVSHAFHSPLMDPMLAEFARVCRGLTYHEPTTTVVSTLTGRPAESGRLRDPDYWVDHVRATVRFHDAARWLLGQGRAVYLETGPGATLSALLHDCLDDPDSTASVTAPLLRGTGDETNGFLTALATAHTHGSAIDWSIPYADTGARPVDLPTYAFQHQRYWLDAPPTPGSDLRMLGLDPFTHPILTAAAAAPGTTLLTGRLSSTAHPWLREHTIGGSLLVPGAAVVDLFLSAGGPTGHDHIEELTIRLPLLVPPDGGLAIRVLLTDPDAGGGRAVSVYARPDSDDTETAWRLHAEGLLAPRDDSPHAPRCSWADSPWPPTDAVDVSVDRIYAELAAAGVEYGPGFQRLRRAWRTVDGYYCELDPQRPPTAGAADFVLHPAILDSALHQWVHATRDAGLRLPFVWSGITVWRPRAVPTRARIGWEPDDTDRLSIELVDAAGNTVARIASIRTRPVDPEQLRRPLGITAAQEDSLYRLRWVPPLDDRAGATPGTWAMLGSAASSVSTGRSTESMRHYPDIAALLAAADKGTPLPDYAVLPCRNGIDAEGDPPGMVAALHDATHRLLDALRSWLADPRTEDCRLVCVTQGAVAARPGDRVTDLVGAALWGLLGSAQAEHPDRFIVVDIDDRTELAALRREMPAHRTQFAIRSGAALEPRLDRADPGELARIPAETSAWRLRVTGAGTVDDLHLAAAPEATRPLDPGTVRVRVHAAGLNFRDVLIAVGVYPGDDVIGSEAAGVVVETAPDVTDLAPGDRVMGLFRGAFGPLAITDHHWVIRIPDDWTMTTGASVPMAFATALYALTDLAAVQPGDSVLVHAAAGGVGSAAVQIARFLGAEVFATAGPDKWQALRDLGLDDDHIASSRDTGFAEKFHHTTHGRGVDVVLNSLTREYIDASLRLLGYGGRFIELGKTDVRTPEQIAAIAPGAAARYRDFDLRDAEPERIRQLLHQARELLRTGALRPLPTTVWDIRRAREAFRFVSQARHIGKVVLTVPASLDPQGTVLVTGGTGGLGAVVARHLVETRGIRRLVLVGRHADSADKVGALVDELSATGADIRVASCDIADPAAVRALLANIPRQHPLTAIYHLAGSIDDGLVESLTPNRLDAVLRPKADGAWHLHEATAHLPLAEFVLFSSAAGILGSPGQGNYAAANTFLDALAHHRHSMGLPATAIAWGLWEQPTGLTRALGDADRARLGRTGLAGLATAEATALLDAARDSGDAFVVAARLDTAAPHADTVPNVLRGLVRTNGSASAATYSVGPELAGLSERERRRRVHDLVAREVCAVLGVTDPTTLSVDHSFEALGVDSLTAVELRNRLRTATGLKLPATLIFDHPSPAAVSECLVTAFADDADPGQDDSGDSTTVLAELDRLDTMLATLAPDNALRERITLRLNALTTNWAHRTGTGTLTTADLAMEPVSTDELFRILGEPDAVPPSDRAADQ